MAAQYRFSFSGPPGGLVIGPRVRVSLVREGELTEPIKIAGSADVYALLRAEAATWDRERFLTLLLTTKHTLIGIDEVSVGSLDSTIVHPRLCGAQHKRGYVAATLMCVAADRR